jgi:hypothetical protein
MGEATRDPLRLWRVDVSDPLLVALIQEPSVASTGFVERDLRPEEMLSGDAFLWRIGTSAQVAGLIWLDTCTSHYACLECGLALRRAGRGMAPAAYLAVVLYAFERLGVSTVCFSAKEYNRQVIEMCWRAGIASVRRAVHQDDYHPDGVSELVEYQLDRRTVGAQRELAVRILHRPVELLDKAGAAAYVASAAGVARFLAGHRQHSAASSEPSPDRVVEPIEKAGQDQLVAAVRAPQEAVDAQMRQSAGDRFDVSGQLTPAQQEP